MYRRLKSCGVRVWRRGILAVMRGEYLSRRIWRRQEVRA